MHSSWQKPWPCPSRAEFCFQSDADQLQVDSRVSKYWSRSIKNRREHQWPAQSAASTAYVLLCVSCLCRLGWTVYVWSTVSCMAEAAVESLANGKGTQLLCQPIKYQHWSDIHQTKSLSAKLIDSNFKIVVLATDVLSYTLCFLSCWRIVRWNWQYNNKFLKSLLFFFWI